MLDWFSSACAMIIVQFLLNAPGLYIIEERPMFVAWKAAELSLSLQGSAFISFKPAFQLLKGQTKHYVKWIVWPTMFFSLHFT